jgi:ADP-ribosylation factor GTPase-activating protein 2/3
MQFFKQHGCNTSDAQQKYKNRAANLYRDKLQQLATQTQRLHGNKVHLDAIAQLSPQPTTEQVDFFDEQVSTLTHNMSSASIGNDAYMSSNVVTTDDDQLLCDGK